MSVHRVYLNGIECLFEERNRRYSIKVSRVLYPSGIGMEESWRILSLGDVYTIVERENSVRNMLTGALLFYMVSGMEPNSIREVAAKVASTGR